jgi:hypothetical protein
VNEVSHEANANNNCSASVAVRVGEPDLEITGFSASPSLVLPGANIYFAATISNEGDATSEVTNIIFYRSADNTIASSDTPQGSQSVNALSAGANSDTTFDFAAPATAGIYYYGACVNEVSHEANVDNNCSSGFEVRVGEPDLEITSFSASPSLVLPGENIYFAATISNEGDATSAATNIIFYRSADNTIASNDTPQGTAQPVNDLSAGTSSDTTFSFAAPAIAGTYYYGACVNEVSHEANVDNNCSSGFEVRVESPDIDFVVLDFFTSTTVVEIDDSITLTAKVRNQGNTAFTATALITFHRSTNNIIDAADEELTIENVGELGVGASSDIGASVAVTSDIGSYYYGACVRPVSGESVTFNNCSKALPVRVVDWEKSADVTWDNRNSHSSVIFQNKMWVLGGAFGSLLGPLRNDVWYSEDGVAWEQATANADWFPRTAHTSLSFADKMWVIAGYTSHPPDDIWFSENGIDWEQAESNTVFSRGRHASLVFDNKMWVIGGTGRNSNILNDVWYSEDGVVWEQATADAAFPPGNVKALVFADKMWVLANHINGATGAWFSSDGRNWQLASDNFPLPIRTNYTSVVFDNKIWLMGGLSTRSKFLNDVWSSRDGRNWQLTDNTADWSARFLHSSLAFDNKIWVIGGVAGEAPDIWSLNFENNNFASALQLSYSASADTQHTAVLEEGVDYYYKITLPAGNYTIDTSSNTNPLCELYDSSQMTIELDHDAGEGFNCSITRTLVTGDYYIRVRGFDNNIGTYTLRIMKQ